MSIVEVNESSPPPKLSFALGSARTCGGAHGTSDGDARPPFYRVVWLYASTFENLDRDPPQVYVQPAP